MQLNFPGNPRLKALLELALQNGSLAGSYLFEGSPGSGQELAALELAACRISGSMARDDDQFQRVLRFAHPDLLFVQPMVAPTGKSFGAMNEEELLGLIREYQGRKQKDPLLQPAFSGKPHISIKAVRAVRKELSSQPFEGEGRALIIRGADTLDAAAQDALLKTLEEPPPGSLIILISYRPEALRPTILSRCQRLPFEALEKETVEGILRERGLAEERARFFASLSAGDLEEAAKLQASESEDGNPLLERRKEWFRFLDCCEFGTEVEMMDAVQDFTRTKAGQGNLTQSRADFLSLAIDWYRDLLGLRGGESSLRVHVDQEDRLPRYENLDAGALADRIQSVEKARDQILRYANANLTFLALFFRLRSIRSSLHA